MLESIDYLTFLQYSPRGRSTESVKSRKVKDSIKAGRIGNFKIRLSQIIQENLEIISPFLNKEVTLIPAPRSSPIRVTDLWPAMEICKILESLDVGSISTCLKRGKAIRKSSLFFNSDERPSIQEQYESMEVHDDVPTKNITLIDDVLTLGRTSIAGASRLADKFPNASIKIFCLIQTKGLIPDVDKIFNMQVGTISYNDNSGKCTRIP